MCLAVPGQIVGIQGVDDLAETSPLERVGKVNFAGVVKEVNLAYVPEARVGDYVIVHVGFAISILDENEAQTVFEYLQEMGEIAELMEVPH